MDLTIAQVIVFCIQALFFMLLGLLAGVGTYEWPDHPILLVIVFIAALLIIAAGSSIFRLIILNL